MKKKNDCNGGWSYNDQLPRIKQPPNKMIPDKKKQQNKNACRDKTIQED